MPGESTKQELAEAILKVIAPLVETGDGTDAGPLEQLASDHAHNISEELQMLFATRQLKPKQP